MFGVGLNWLKESEALEDKLLPGDIQVGRLAPLVTVMSTKNLNSGPSARPESIARVGSVPSEQSR